MTSRRVIVLALGLLLSVSAWAQSADVNPSDPDRMQAFDLYHQHKLTAAAAALEKVVAKYPKDAAAHEALGASLLGRADTQTDPAKHKADRLQARAELLRAKELGDDSDLCQALLSMLPEDGSEVDFSANAEVNAAMNRGEAQFAEGHWQEAIQEYQHALALDPKLYLAALDIGDCYYRLADVDKAGEWFGKAVAIAPNQEVAYRYWGDALLQADRMAEARAKYIAGAVANPYVSTSFAGLNNWVSRSGRKYQAIPRIPAGPATDEQGKTVINLDPSGTDSTRAAWLAYSLERALWKREKFAKEYPQEKAYRHSLKEEVSALSTAATVYAETQAKKKDAQPDAALTLLGQYKNDGMLEAFVLLVRPDQGIAQDYEAYRDAHRETLKAFLDKYILPAGK